MVTWHRTSDVLQTKIILTYLQSLKATQQFILDDWEKWFYLSTSSATKRDCWHFLSSRGWEINFVFNIQIKFIEEYVQNGTIYLQFFLCTLYTHPSPPIKDIYMYKIMWKFSGEKHASILLKDKSKLRDSFQLQV